jgi:peptidoglycan-N-acetylglucosamine deacetylase
MKIVQCWDDGNVDDIRLIELLRIYGAKASFNLNYDLHQEKRYLSWKYQDTKEVWKLSLPELKSVYDGFLVANHMLTHPWPTRIPVEEMEREIVEGKDRLEQYFGYEVKGFAYPFGDYNPIVEDAVRRAGHVYARTCENTPNVVPPVDAMAFHSSRHQAASDFWEEYERVRAVDGTFYFWGHSYEFISEADWQEIERKMARMAADARAEWCNLPDLFA